MLKICFCSWLSLIQVIFTLQQWMQGTLLLSSRRATPLNTRPLSLSDKGKNLSGWSIHMNSFHSVMDIYRRWLVTISEETTQRHRLVEWALAMAAAEAVTDSSSSTAHSKSPSFLIISSVRLGGLLARCLWLPILITMPLTRSGCCNQPFEVKPGCG